MVYENENEALPTYQFQPVYDYIYEPFDYQPYMMYQPYMHHQVPPFMNMDQQPYFQEIPQQGQTSSTNSVMQQFLDENGNVDIQKMLSTVGQLADTVQQVTPVIRQLNDLIRSFRA